MLNHKPKQAMPVMLARTIPNAQNQAPAPLYSRGEQIVMSIIASLIVFGFSFNITRSIVWRLTGYVPPVRCGSVQAEFERQVAEGAISWEPRQDSLSVVVGGEPGGDSLLRAAR